MRCAYEQLLTALDDTSLFSQTIAVGDPTDRHATYELDALISKLVPCGLLEHLSRIAIDFAETSYEAITEYQASLIEHYAATSPLAEDVKQKLRAGKFTYLTTAQQISNLLLYVIAREDPEPRTYDRNSIPRDGSFLTILLLFNYYGLIDPRTNAFYFQENPLQSEFSQIGNITDRYLNHSYRYLQLLQWSESESARTSNDFLPIKTDFETAMAMTFLEYATASWLVEAYYTEGPKLLATSYPWLQLAEYFTTSTDLRYLSMFVRQNSFSRDDLLDAFDGVTPRRLCSEGFLFTLRHSLYVNGNAYLLISKTGLDNTLGAGLFFRLFDFYKSGEGERHLRLTRFFGQFFEDYVYETLKRIGDASGGIVFREQRSNGDRSTDVILVNDDAAVFAEVYSGRVPIDAIQSGSPAIIGAAIDKCVFKKAMQLDRNINNFRNGNLKFNGINNETVTKIYPVIVMPHAFPRSADIQAVIDEQITQKGWLRGARGLEIVAAETLEGLEEHVDRDLTLQSLLDQKLGSVTTRRDSFKNFLIHSGVISQLRIGKIAHERLDSWIADIQKTAGSWAPKGSIFT